LGDNKMSKFRFRCLVEISPNLHVDPFKVNVIVVREGTPAVKVEYGGQTELISFSTQQEAAKYAADLRHKIVTLKPECQYVAEAYYDKIDHMAAFTRKY